MAWQQRVSNVFRGRRLQRELDREVRFHIAERADEFEHDGMSRTDALRAAHRQFGNVTGQIERTRDMDINARLDSAVGNLRYGARALLKTPGFTATVILTLALGIGANSAVFSAIYAVLLRPLPFPNADRLVQVSQSHPRFPITFVAPVRLEDWNRLNTTFDGISGYYSEDTSETSGDLPEKLKRAWVAPRFLQVLGVAPEVGRNFTSQEEHAGGPNAVLISHRLWMRRFGGDPNVTGKLLRLPKTPWTVVGVMPASFQFPNSDVDLWAVSPPDFVYAQSRDLTWFTAIGRMKAGMSIEAARANLAAVQAGLGRQFPKSDGPIATSIAPLKTVTVGGVSKSLWLLFGSVSLLLLIACTNVAALLLSRAAARRHEIAIRFSLGASRGTVAAQLFTEVLVLAVAGAFSGLLLASLTSRVFRALAKDLPRVDEIGLDSNIVLYSLACAAVVTLVCGIAPVLRGTGRSLSEGLAQGGRSNVAGRNPVQFVLVGVQVALAVILLAGAGLLLRSFQELGRVSPGFDAQHVLLFHISSSWAEAGGAPARQRTERILDGLRAVPGVDSAAVALSLPGEPGKYEIEMGTVEGRAESEPKMIGLARWITPGYFSVLRIPLLAGEFCRTGEEKPGALVNRSFANLYLKGAAAIGRHLIQPANPSFDPAEIRGIVGDVRETGLDRDPPPTAYWCAGAMQPSAFFLVRVQGDPASMASTLRRRMHEIEPVRSVFDIAPFATHIADAYAENRLRMVLLGFFALTAIALASVGLYGTLSYMVNVRQREVALRIALGALRTQVVRQFLNQGMRAAGIGCAAGIVLAAAFRKLLAGMLYGVSATDAATLAGVVGIVLTVSIAASLIPAVRAARVEPNRTLREE